MTRPAAAPVPFVDIRINGNRASVSEMVAEARGLQEGDTVDPDTLQESGWRDWLAFAAWGAALEAILQLVAIWAENHARNR